MKPPAPRSPFVDGEVLGQPAGMDSPFEHVMPEPPRTPMPALAASGLRILGPDGQPLPGAAWRVHQGTATFRGVTDAFGDTGLLAMSGPAFDRAQPFRLHVDGYVCSIVSGAVLRVDDPAVMYGGPDFDWHAADSADPQVKRAFWADYAARRGRDGAPFRFIQHDHVMRRPVRWLAGSGMAVFQAQPLAIRVGPLVRYTDERQARIWLELDAPGLVRVRYGAAPSATAKPTGSPPAQEQQRHVCSVRVGGRHFALLTLDGLSADTTVVYTLELAPQPPTGPLPVTEIDFTEAAFPRKLPTAVLDAQQKALRLASVIGSSWLFLRTLPTRSDGLRFAHGSCRGYPGDDSGSPDEPRHDLLDHFGGEWLRTHEIAQWPQFFVHTGDQIYADDIGRHIGRSFAEQRFAATVPGPAGVDGLIGGAWAGRFARRHVARAAVLPLPDATKLKAQVDDLDHERNTARNPQIIEAAVERARRALKRRAVHAGATAPPARKLQVLNHLLWEVPVDPDDQPLVDPRRGLMQRPTYRILKPEVRDIKLPYAPAGDVGGIHAADFAEYAALYEQAWCVPGARRALAHVPHYMIFDDHEVTDDWNADPGWLARIHDRSDPLQMWPATITDALAGYWVYQGWGNLAPAVAAADARVAILERARRQGHDALPELRRLIHDHAVAPTKKGAARTKLLDWNFRVPTPGAPFLVVDLRTNREVHGAGGMSKPRLDWLETALRAARTPAAFVVLPVPMLLPAPLMFAMNHPTVGAVAAGHRTTADFKRDADIEHPATNLVWSQFRDLLPRLQRAGSPLRTLVIVSGDIHFSCNLDGQFPKATRGPRLLQLVSSGIKKTIPEWKQKKLESAYRGWLQTLTRSDGVEEQRGLVITLGGIEDPAKRLDNFVYPTSMALVELQVLRGGKGNATRLPNLTQRHLLVGDKGRLEERVFQHLARDDGSALMTLHDPGPANPNRPSPYPASGPGAIGLVHEAEEAQEPEAGDFELRHDRPERELEANVEVLHEDEPAAAEDFEPESGAEEAPPEPMFEDEVIGSDDRKPVADPLDVPHRWVCALDVVYDKSPMPARDAKVIPDATRATGILVGPRHVLTAAHVVERLPVTANGNGYSLRAARIDVTPGRDGDNSRAPIVKVKAAHWMAAPQHWQDVQTSSGIRRLRWRYDYALLVLERDIADLRHPKAGRLGWWGEDPAVSELRTVTPADVAAGSVTVAGYPGDTCGRTILPRAGLVRKMQDCWRLKPDAWAAQPFESSGAARIVDPYGVLFHQADTFEGESGSPVFTRRDGVWWLMGVHGGHTPQSGPGGGVTDNDAVALHPRVLQQLCDWINGEKDGTRASMAGGRLVLTRGGVAHELEAEPAEAYQPEAQPADEAELPGGDPVRSTARQLERGLAQAEAWLRRRPRSGLPELLRFAVSLLRTHFFPTGYGISDAAGRLLKPSAVARIAMQLRGAQRQLLPFEHRLRLTVTAREAEDPVVAARHHAGGFSDITLFAPTMAGLASEVALQHALHEVLHALLALVERLRAAHGDAMADAFLAKDPWSLLDLRRWHAERRRIRGALGPLLQRLGAPEPAEAAAGRLVEEAFAHTLAMHLRFALQGGSGSRIVSSSVTEVLVKHYVVDHAPRLSSQLGTAELAAAAQALKPALDALQASMNALWEAGDARSSGASPSAREEPAGEEPAEEALPIEPN